MAHVSGHSGLPLSPFLLPYLQPGAWHATAPSKHCTQAVSPHHRVQINALCTSGLVARAAHLSVGSVGAHTHVQLSHCTATHSLTALPQTTDLTPLPRSPTTLLNSSRGFQPKEQSSRFCCRNYRKSKPVFPAHCPHSHHKELWGTGGLGQGSDHGSSAALPSSGNRGLPLLPLHCNGHGSTPKLHTRHWQPHELGPPWRPGFPLQKPGPGKDDSMDRTSKECLPPMTHQSSHQGNTQVRGAVPAHPPLDFRSHVIREAKTPETLRVHGKRGSGGGWHLPSCAHQWSH